VAEVATGKELQDLLGEYERKPMTHVETWGVVQLINLALDSLRYLLLSKAKYLSDFKSRTGVLCFISFSILNVN
jgi:hypothetical protein